MSRVISYLLPNSEEYERRKQTPFEVPKADLAQIRASIPKHLYQKSTSKGLYYVVRDVLCAAFIYKAGTYIEPLTRLLQTDYGFTGIQCQFFKWSLWCTYWWWQGLVLAGWWCLGHEAGHGNLSSQSWINHILGYTLHTSLLVPYFSWRSSHHAHHKTTGWVERDENYVPFTRTDYGLPPAAKAHSIDYHEVFEETPLYTLFRMLSMQLFGWQYYLTANALGSPRYPQGTNHFQPSSALFRPAERNKIVLSNVGLATTTAILAIYTRHAGIANFFKLYFVPYLLANHWIVMITYLHHSDPTIPHYRTKEWTFLRGALATVDRPLLSWAGRFFLHNVSHDHVAHHLFSMIPFYHQPEVTKCLKKVLKDDYNYDSTSAFRALYRSFTDCLFIEDEGDIVFYKNKYGEAQRVLKDDTSARIEVQ